MADKPPHLISPKTNYQQSGELSLLKNYELRPFYLYLICMTGEPSTKCNPLCLKIFVLCVCLSKNIFKLTLIWMASSHDSNFLLCTNIPTQGATFQYVVFWYTATIRINDILSILISHIYWYLKVNLFFSRKPSLFWMQTKCTLII